MAYYRIILVVHIIAIISWMAGILYLFRLFINHAEKGRQDEKIHSLFVGMEERLYRIITRPAMNVAAIAGIAMLALNPSLLKEHWMMVKVVCVTALIMTTVYAKRMMLHFALMENSVPSSKKLRLLNELPTLLMIIIVSMVILRPF